MMVYYLLTEQCNLNCSHCIRGEHKPVSAIDYKTVIDRLTEYYDSFCLVITGGEPTLSPVFKEVIDYALLKKVRNILIVSNGAYSNAKTLFADYADNNRVSVQFSIDGNEEKHDYIRGEGAFKRTIDTIEQLNDIGINSMISSVVTKDNIASFSELAPVLEKLDVIKWHINPVLPFGRAKDISEYIDTDTWNKFVDSMKQISSLRLSIHKMYDFSVLEKMSDDELKKYEKVFSQSSNCMSGKNKLYIYPDGTVYGCTCLLKFPFGNIYDSPVKDILDTENARKIIDYKINEESRCADCRYVSLCKGGCIGMSVSYFGKLGFGDIRCPLLKEKML